MVRRVPVTKPSKVPAQSYRTGIVHTLTRVRSKGQALVIVALAMTVLVLFVGLGVDAGNLMSRQAKLQSAVDAATLSAAQLLSDSATTIRTTPQIKVKQVLEANGIAISSLANLTVTVNTELHQVNVQAEQRIDTFFVRIIPAFSIMNVSSQATGDLNAYAEIDAKPYGIPGVVNELNLQVWGADSRRHNGDNYSPHWMYYSGPAAAANPAPNPEHAKMPYGYLYRIDVPSSYSSDDLVLQIFDPDSYNRDSKPPVYATATPTCSGPITGTVCVTPTPPNPGNPDMYASCANPRSGTCSSDSTDSDVWERANPAMKLNGFPDRNGSANGRPAFWRVDELRYAYNEDPSPHSGKSDHDHATYTKYSLWHFDPAITSAFGNPATMADKPVGAAIATYVVGADASTDLRWYQPPGFNVHLADYEPELGSSGWSFYLYVEGLGVPSGQPGIRSSSENNFDLRVGPPGGDNPSCLAAELDDVDAKGYPSTYCYVNRLYFEQMKWLQGAPGASNVADWNDGGARILAKRALPLNLDTGTQFPMRLTQVNKNAAGQVLEIRHFDQDCGGSYPCGSNAAKMTYQMQVCGCSNTESDSCYLPVHAPNGTNVVGDMSGNDLWVWTTAQTVAKELVQIPTEDLSPGSDYRNFFGPTDSGQTCTSSWLRIYRYPSYGNDTSVWELPYSRPRLIK